MKRIFLDSSVLFTAVNSPTGGSAKLFTLDNIILVVSPLVLAEVERNVDKKLRTYHRERFFTLAKHLSIIDQQPGKRKINLAEKVIVRKDAVILAEARVSKCFALATLDQHHFFTQQVRTFLKPMHVMTPKEILDEFG